MKCLRQGPSCHLSSLLLRMLPAIRPHADTHAEVSLVAEISKLFRALRTSRSPRNAVWAIFHPFHPDPVDLRRGIQQRVAACVTAQSWWIFQRRSGNAVPSQAAGVQCRLRKESQGESAVCCGFGVVCQIRHLSLSEQAGNIRAAPRAQRSLELLPWA